MSTNEYNSKVSYNHIRSLATSTGPSMTTKSPITDN